LTHLTLGEIRKGGEDLTFGNRKERLRLWLEHDLPAWFEERVLAVGAHVADQWGRLVSEAGRPVPAIDSLLAATALRHGLRLVTLNEQDLEKARSNVTLMKRETVRECLTDVGPTDCVVYGAQADRCDRGQAGRSLETWTQPEGNHRLPWAAQQHSKQYLEGKMLA